MPGICGVFHSNMRAGSPHDHAHGEMVSPRLIRGTWPRDCIGLLDARGFVVSFRDLGGDRLLRDPPFRRAAVDQPVHISAEPAEDCEGHGEHKADAQEVAAHQPLTLQGESPKSGLATGASRRRRTPTAARLPRGRGPGQTNCGVNCSSRRAFAAGTELPEVYLPSTFGVQAVKHEVNHYPGHGNVQPDRKGPFRPTQMPGALVHGAEIDRGDRQDGTVMASKMWLISIREIDGTTAAGSPEFSDVALVRRSDR